MRPLSPTEKAALAKTLSQAVTNPNAAQFKWLPVAANGSGPIGYCGLVNVKGSHGEYVGFRRFFATISKGPKGDYIKGQIEHIDGIPVSSGGSSTEGGGSPKRTAGNGGTRISAAPLEAKNVFSAPALRLRATPEPTATLASVEPGAATLMAQWSGRSRGTFAKHTSCVDNATPKGDPDLGGRYAETGGIWGVRGVT